MYKIELELINDKWYGTFHHLGSVPFKIELAYLSISTARYVQEDMQARNPGTNVVLKETQPPTATVR